MFWCHFFIVGTITCDTNVYVVCGESCTPTVPRSTPDVILISMLSGMV